LQLPLKNIKGESWLVATKEVPPGVEMFWNYRDHDMWKSIKKLQLKDCIEKVDLMLFRDNEIENERVLNLLKK
jgi:hypothetical protein